MKGLAIALVAVLLAGCVEYMRYPPRLAPMRGQSADQQDADARDCDHKVHSAANMMLRGTFSQWTKEERDGYVACMEAKGYTVIK